MNAVRHVRPTARQCNDLGTFVLIAAAGVLFALTAGKALAGDAADASTGGFRFKDISEKSVGLWENEQPVLVYHHGEITKPGVRRANRSSYIHPIYGLDGEVLTDDFPEDHYHHHGMFWAWPHVTVGDRHYDLWKPQGIRIDFERWLAKESDGGQARLGVENVWVADNRPVMREQVWLQVHPATAEGRNLDVRLKWTPIDEPITLRGAAEKSYGGFSIRFGPNSNTVITVPTGRTQEDLLMTNLPWADYSGHFSGASGPSGAAIFVHPEHPDFPPEWLTRHFGLMAVGWPGVNAQTLPAGQTVTCRYRIWIHRGVPEAEEIDQVYDAYRNAQ